MTNQYQLVLDNKVNNHFSNSIQFRFSKWMDVYESYPDTLSMGLSKIGGIIAVLNIGVLLRMIHRRSFEKSVQKRQQQPKTVLVNDSEITIDKALLLEPKSNSEFKEAFTFQKILEFADKMQRMESVIEELVKKVDEQRVEISELKRQESS